MNRRSFLAITAALNMPLLKTTITPDHSTMNKDIEALRAQLKGTLLLSDDAYYQSASQAWNLNVQQRPAIVVIAASTQDLQLAVKFATHHDMGVSVMATGHGVGRPCNGGLLINTSKLRGVTINPVTHEATVESGALWKDVISMAKAHGLAALAGSAPHVGVVGYTLGGGFGYLGRKYGLNANSVTRAEVITADGKNLRVSENENNDLFWTVKGGGGNFGIIASLTFRLYPIKNVFGGAVFYAMEHAHHALTTFAKWSKQLPAEISAAFTFMNVPPLPSVPEILRGKSVVVMKGCYCGENPENGEQLFSPLRAIGKPIIDTFGIMPVEAMDTISKDPVDPMGVLQYGGMIRDLSPEAIDAFIKITRAESGGSLLMIELRKLGAALAQTHGSINLLGNSDAQFSINALGSTHTPAVTAKTQAQLALLAETTKPYQTGEVFLNFMEVDPSEARVRAAYTTDHWERLIALKKKYDPQNIFRFNRNIPVQ